MSNNSTTKGDLTEWSEFEAARVLAGIKTKILNNESDDETRNENNDLKTRNGFDLELAMSKEEVACQEGGIINKDGENGLTEEPKSSENINCLSNYPTVKTTKGKHNLTEAEKEQKRMRRVLANRESARETIRRRQAFREELIKKVADLSLDNHDIKMQRERLMNEYNTLKDNNKQLKEWIAKAKHCPETSSKTAIPVTGYSFAPYPWTSWSPFSYDLGNSLGSCGVYVPHHAWFHPHTTSGPLPMYVGTNIHGSVPYFHHQTNASSSTIVSAMQDGSDEHDHLMHLFLNSPSSDAQGKSLVQPASVSVSAAEARKKRKELTKLKHLQGKQKIWVAETFQIVA
ncbi:Basic-leucine zipper domain-containing protein [Dioscorea alata]|uniref:Basic-leucine zipper domain-containing protein n=1 Tax=Dioscorea alata TaxID=55571 RepID=A0ACB7VCL7_DIOAL|nr:Basic-leucine zipper domain-containing protein [Dioscorea alata]